MADKRHLLAPCGPHQSVCISEVSPIIACLQSLRVAFVIPGCPVDSRSMPCSPCALPRPEAALAVYLHTACAQCAWRIAHCTCPPQGGASRCAGAESRNSHMFRLCPPRHKCACRFARWKQPSARDLAAHALPWGVEAALLTTVSGLEQKQQVAEHRVGIPHIAGEGRSTTAHCVCLFSGIHWWRKTSSTTVKVQQCIPRGARLLA